MNPKLFFSALLFASFLFSCNQDKKQEAFRDTILANPEKKEPSPQNNKEEKQKLPAAKLIQDPGDSLVAQFALQPAAHTDWDKKIIKTATVKLEITDFKKYNEAVHKTIRNFGGYIAQEEQHLTEEKSETILSIKVPVERFETMMNELPTPDTKVLERLVTSEDVTGEVIDIKSRLEAKKQVRLKYLDFLKASKNMEEVLKVQGEINGIQEEMEAAAGRIGYLSHQSAFSTIHLTFYQPAAGFKPIETSPGFLKRVDNAFKTGADWIADISIALLSVWPLLVFTLGGIFVFKRLKYLNSVNRIRKFEK